MSEVKRLEMDHKGLPFVDDNGVYVLYEDYAEIKAQRDALASEKNWWKPDCCPVTNRPFFLWIKHPSGGMVPTYGGPYDSYTIPTLDSDGEFCCERYDHDEGAWVDSECLSVRLADDREPEVDDAYLNSVRAEGADKVAEYHFVRIEALKEVSRQGHLFHKAAYSDAVNVANLFRAGEPS